MVITLRSALFIDTSIPERKAYQVGSCLRDETRNRVYLHRMPALYEIHIGLLFGTRLRGTIFICYSCEQLMGLARWDIMAFKFDCGEFSIRWCFSNIKGSFCISMVVIGRVLLPFGQVTL